MKNLLIYSEEDITNVRKFFLDPEGTNVDSLVEKTNQLLEDILSNYTGMKIDIKTDIVNEGNYKERKIRSSISRDDIISKVKKSSLLSMPESETSLDDMVFEIGDLMKDEIQFNQYFVGQMHPHDNIISVIAGLAAKLINGNTIAEEVSRVSTFLEKQVINWLAFEFGYNPNLSFFESISNNTGMDANDFSIKEPISAGHLTTGGTSANLTALLIARNKAIGFYDNGNHVIEKGLVKGNDCVVLGSEYSHYSLEKICNYIGLGTSAFKRVKTVNGRIQALQEGEGSLRKMMWDAGNSNKKIVAIVGSCGTTEMGNIDDLDGIAYLIKNFEEEFGYKPHFHVDAAHGGGFVFHPRFNPKKNGLFKGIEKSDSITIDPHKMLFTNYSAGAILFKDRNDYSLLKQVASYLFKENSEVNIGQFRVEGSMGLDAVLQTWASLKALGKENYTILQNHLLELTNYFHKKISAEDKFQVLNEVDTNVLCFRYYDPRISYSQNEKINTLIHSKLLLDGDVYISSDNLLYRNNGVEENITVMRSVIMHPYTTPKTIDVVFDKIKKQCQDVIRDVDLRY